MPVAIVVWIIQGEGIRSLPEYYLVSLILTSAGWLGVWAARWLVLPGIRRASQARGKSPFLGELVMYLGAAFLAGFLGAIVVNFTLVPGLLGGARQVAVVTLFGLVFVGGINGIMYMIEFYRHSLERARSEQEMALARRIQSSFQPACFPERPRFDVHAANIPSRQVSGDFYDVVPVGEDAFFLAIADVAGKGVPAALLSAALQASLRTLANLQTSTAAILENMNALLYRSTAVDQFATFFLARIEEGSLRLTYSNAGHNHPIVFRAVGGQVPLEHGGTVLGISEAACFEERALVLTPGDRVLLYSDGITEAFNPGGEPFGEKRLCDLVSSLPADLSARDMVARIFDAVRVFLGDAEPGDDMTLLVLRLREEKT